MKIDKLFLYTPLKSNNPLISNNISKSSGIYFLFDELLNLIYIGKTKNIRQRLVQHITPNNNNRLDINGILPPKEVYTTKIPFGEVKYYSYIEEPNEDERTLKEAILISLFKPRYNYNFYSVPTFFDTVQKTIKDM